MILWHVLWCGVQASAAVPEMSFPPSVLEDPPLGEGWDENGNDLSKIANDVSLVVSVHDVLPKKIVREDGKKWQKVCGGD